MYKLFFVIGFLVVVACHPNKTSVRKTNGYYTNKQTDSLLIGGWMIYSFGSIQKVNDTLSREIEMHCNASAVVVFKANKTGYIQGENGVKGPGFKWKLEGKSLIINNFCAIQPVIHDGTYAIINIKPKKIKLLDSIHGERYNLANNSRG